MIISKRAQAIAVHGPRTRSADDHVGSRSEMKYGARMSQTLTTCNEWDLNDWTSSLWKRENGKYLKKPKRRNKGPSLLMRCQPGRRYQRRRRSWSFGRRSGRTCYRLGWCAGRHDGADLPRSIDEMSFQSDEKPSSLGMAAAFERCADGHCGKLR